jgi:hypothetical protein
VFKQLSGLKISFHKSKLYCFGKAKEHELNYTHLLDVRWALPLLIPWYLPHIISSFVTGIGRTSNIVLKDNSFLWQTSGLD